jgi:transcriptional regulator with XRE-family HTH domain
MKVTAQTIEKINKGMSDKGMNQTQLADAIGVSRGYISRLLKGDYAKIPDEQAHKISKALEIILIPHVFQEGTVSDTALQLSTMADEDPAFSRLLEILIDIKGGDPRKAFIPSIDSQFLAEVGSELVRIVHQWEEPTGNYSPKVAVEVLKYLREFFRKGAF